MEKIIAAYEEHATAIFNQYMAMYLAEYPGEKTRSTARMFLIKQNDAYRNAINSIAMSSIRTNAAGKTISDKIIELNNSYTTKLHDEIMDISK